jgi:hypothetical protein
MSLFDTFKDSNENDKDVDREEYRERVMRAVDLCLQKGDTPVRGVLVIQQDVGTDAYELAMISLNANLEEMGAMMLRGVRQVSNRIVAYQEMESDNRVLN